MWLIINSKSGTSESLETKWPYFVTGLCGNRISYADNYIFTFKNSSSFDYSPYSSLLLFRNRVSWHAQLSSERFYHTCRMHSNVKADYRILAAFLENLWPLLIFVLLYTGCFMNPIVISPPFCYPFSPRLSYYREKNAVTDIPTPRRKLTFCKPKAGPLLSTQTINKI